MTERPVSHDALLGGRVSLRQPAAGYRVAIDPVLLAAATPARAGQRVLDAGAGVGAAGLCLAARLAEVRITGLELDPGLAELATFNAVQNGFADRLEVIAGDVARPPAEVVAGGFDHVMTNPPFLAAGGAPSPDRTKRRATVESHVPLALWIDHCLKMTRPRGTLTLIHRADRLDEILAALAGRAGQAVIFPLWPRAGQAAKRVIIQARKAVAGPCRVLPGLALHQEDGAYSAAAQTVLRDGQGLQGLNGKG